MCFDPSFNKQLATKPPWPSIKDVLQLSSESLQTIPFEGFMQNALISTPLGPVSYLLPPQQILRPSCRLPTNQPTSGDQSVALSAGTTLELGLMDTGRLMASCREAQRNNDNDDGFKGEIGWGGEGLGPRVMKC